MRQCPVCAESNVSYLYPLRRHNELQVFKCHNCVSQFVFPQPQHDELLAIYSQQYYRYMGIEADKEDSVIRQMKLSSFFSRLQRLQKFVKTGRLLDVGCATGNFAAISAEHGFETYGVEVSGYGAKKTEKLLGKGRVYNGELPDCKFENGSFSAITMFDVIEHVVSPLDVLRRASELLADNGVLMLTTPNTNSLSCRLMRKNWVQYKFEHIYYFNRRSLRWLANQSGFTIVSIQKEMKPINFEYIHRQLLAYPHKFFNMLFGFLYRLLPRSLRARNFHLSTGEVAAILKKTG